MLSQGRYVCKAQGPGGKSESPKNGMGTSRWKPLKTFALSYTLDYLRLQRWPKLPPCRGGRS